MKTISQNYIFIGTIRKPFGSSGFLRLQISDELTEIIQTIKHMYVSDMGHYLPYFIEETYINGEILVKFDECESPENCKALVNKDVYISDDQIDMKKYLKKVTKVAIKGFRVISEGVLLGVIDELEEFPSQIMARVNGENRTDFMFPLVESYILNVDFKGKAIQVCLPEGLIDM